MEEPSEDDIKLVTDTKELQDVIQVLQRDVMRLESVYREERNQLLNKRQREINAKRRLVIEKSKTSVDQVEADDTELYNLMAMQSRFLAEAKVLKAMKPSANENTTIVNLYLEKELKETTENLRHLIRVTEKQILDLRATLKRLDVAIDRDRKITESIQLEFDEKMQALEANPAERTKHRIRVLKSNVRKVKRSTTELWDKLAKFLEAYFPSMPNTGTEQGRENGQPHRYGQLSEMIQELINAHMGNTGNPYLKIDKTWNPGYVKMLLGRGICVQHPQQPDHIKLEQYL